MTNFRMTKVAARANYLNCLMEFLGGGVVGMEVVSELLELFDGVGMDVASVVWRVAWLLVEMMRLMHFGWVFGLGWDQWDQ